MRKEMLLSTTIVLGSSLLTVQAITLPSSFRRIARSDNPCGPGGTPELYHEYDWQVCPPKQLLDFENFCDIHQGPGDCMSYCEDNQEFFYDQEGPLDNTYCHGPLTCTVGTSSAYQFTRKVDANVKWTKGLDWGITGGFSQAWTTTDVRSTSVKLDEGQCGYFTFLPILHKSCGVVTDAPTKGCDPFGWGSCACWEERKTNHPNTCTTQPYRSTDGKLVLGDTVFVKTNCSNRKRLPMDQQDPAYQHDGVAAPQSLIEVFLSGDEQDTTGSNPPPKKDPPKQDPPKEDPPKDDSSTVEPPIQPPPGSGPKIN